MLRSILADVAVSVTELKKNPMASVTAGEGFPVAVLNHNEPAFYYVPAAAWEMLLERLEDAELNTIANRKKDDPETELTIEQL